MKQKGAGFTLIELLVVIAIIAILAAILFPLFMIAKQTAQTKSCLNNMVQLGKGFRMYLDDWSAYPGSGPWGGPRLGDWVLNIGTWPNNYQDVRKGAIWGYVRNEKVYVCPSDKTQLRTINNRRVYFGLSYGMNSNFKWLKESSVKRVTSTVFLVCEGAGCRVPGKPEPIPISDGNFGAGTDGPATVHQEGCNFLFPDGHAKLFRQKEFAKLRFAL